MVCQRAWLCKCVHFAGDVVVQLCPMCWCAGCANVCLSTTLTTADDFDPEILSTYQRPPPTVLFCNLVADPPATTFTDTGVAKKYGWLTEGTCCVHLCSASIHSTPPIMKRQCITSSAHCLLVPLLLPSAITLLGKGEAEHAPPPAKKSKAALKTKDELEVEAALRRIDDLKAPLEVPWCRCTTVCTPEHLGTVHTQ